VNRLQKQMNELLSLHSQYGLNYSSLDGDSYAFAAELENEVPQYSDEHKVISENEPVSAEAEENLEVKETEDKELVKDAADSDPHNAKSGKYANKKVYLTFDDGPSIYTDDILDILAEYHIKATFFVVGKTDNQSIKLYQRIVDEGHTLGMHSYSHQYSQIYNSLEDFDKDFTKLWKLLYDTTGYKPSIFRFPGGSDNMVNKNGMEDFIRYLNEAGIVYFDWNVLNGDATGEKFTKDQLIENVLKDVAVKDNSIVLMHDSETKQTTIDSLPGLLEKLISEDAQILPLDHNVPPIQMIKADTIE
jgi:peptidoglycan/xylan/chitin deacetylase (PgdA/CDA1 family)